MLVGIISQLSSITCQIPPGTDDLWPLNWPKLGFPLSKSKSFHAVFIKLSEYVGEHNIPTKFYNLLNPPRHSCIMALELSKNWISGICSPSRISCSQKSCHYHWKPQIWQAYFVSVWHSCYYYYYYCNWAVTLSANTVPYATAWIYLLQKKKQNNSSITFLIWFIFTGIYLHNF